MTSWSLRFLKINQGGRDVSCFNAVTKWESNGNTGKNGSGEVLFIQGSECQSFHAHLTSQRAPLGVSPKPRRIIQDANSSHTSTKGTLGQPPSSRFSTLSVFFTHSHHTWVSWLTQREKGVVDKPHTVQGRHDCETFIMRFLWWESESLQLQTRVVNKKDKYDFMTTWVLVLSSMTTSCKLKKWSFSCKLKITKQDKMGSSVFSAE